MLKLQIQGFEFIVDVVHVDSMEEPEGENTMCLAKVGNVTFQYPVDAEKAYSLFKSDMAKAIILGEVKPQQRHAVPFLVVQYHQAFKIDWEFYERRLRGQLIASQLAADHAKGVAEAAISKAAGGPATELPR
ncbi:hypothetical protein QRD43_20625 [Pelomonas sp. APW6]|uniref:Uncharacterized protein n=1 Tax=Roseateles subflavus TaxID=3053353 RepID=A0ABT7LNE3_9BURK|nr:hypothetical protein [Pelomonas sp. APW6]MDL5034319.1 hypothetical protein [Pelomonas sp. APW6]